MILSIAACGNSKSNETPTDDVSVQLVNPMVPGDKDTIKKEIGVKLNIPEKAQQISYYIINDEVGQADFTLDDVDYCLRVKKSELFDDISGEYYSWIKNEKITVSDKCDGELHVFENEDENVVCVLWLDSKADVMYTLSGRYVSADDVISLAETIYGK